MRLSIINRRPAAGLLGLAILLLLISSHKVFAIDARITYSTLVGSAQDDYPGRIALDSAGNIYICGTTRSTDWPIAQTAAPPVNESGNYGFVIKLDRRGRSVLYLKFLGDSCRAIAIDAQDNVYVTGNTGSREFPVTPDALQPLFQGRAAGLNGDGDGFVAKLDANGAIVYASYLGGSSNDGGNGIAVDTSGNFYVTGYTSSPDLPITPGCYQAKLSGAVDAFVAKFDARGAQLYTTYLGGAIGNDYGNGIAVDAGGHAFVVGTTGSQDFPTTPGAFETFYGLYNQQQDAFVTKLNAAGSALDYSTRLGGTETEEGRAIAIDLQGNAYVTGFSWSEPTTFSGHRAFPVKNALQKTCKGVALGGAFLTKFNSTGSDLVYSTFFCGTSYANALAVDAQGNAYIAGFAYLLPYFTSQDPLQDKCNCKGDDGDSFIAEFAASGKPLLFSSYFGGNHDDEVNGLALSRQGDILLLGRTTSNKFPLNKSLQAHNNGGSDIFVTRIKHNH